jgi:hypothetical protein
MLKQTELSDNSNNTQGVTIVLDNRQSGVETVYSDMSLAEARDAAYGKDVPEKIRQMLHLYEYGDGSFKKKCWNFYQQGKFMEDYEDDAPWDGKFERYFPTYHDLTIPKLRGYFTWRTNVRKGIYRPIATSLAYIYIYELLNGIGTTSTEETLWKMQEFETEFLDTEIGDWMMKFNLHRWMLEFAVIHQLPKKLTLTFANPNQLERDRKITILRNPENYTDEEIFSTLSHFATGKLETSSVITKNPNEGRHLFAEVWRYTLAHYNENGKDLITACFGPWKAFPWYPLANSVYFETRDLTDFDYELNECRIYQYREGRWFVQTYEELLYDKKKISSLLRETDRSLRIYLKTGHPLRQKTDDAWAIPYVETVIEADRQAKIEAARPKVNINLDSLIQIRQDAVVTRESLLTDEDKAEASIEPAPVEVLIADPVAEKNYYTDINSNVDIDVDSVNLDPIHRQILLTLIHGDSADELIRTHRLIPSVVTDALNEAFYDEIGDSILDCDGERISLMEDYIEDVTLLVGL